LTKDKLIEIFSIFQDPESYISAVLEKVRKDYLLKTYKIESWENDEQFLENLARKMGKLLKKGEPDLNAVARIVLNDLQRGKLPYYVAPKEFETPLPVEETAAPEAAPEEPKIEEQTAENGDDSKPEEVKESEPAAPSTIKVDQDLTKIKMAIDFDNPDDENPSNEPVAKIDIDEILKPEDLPGLEGAPSDDNESSDDDAEGEETVTRSGKFTVSSTGKRKADGAGAAKNLTAKDRRALDRLQKRKKIGSNFYEVTNVKNRNRDKDKPTNPTVRRSSRK